MVAVPGRELAGHGRHPLTVSGVSAASHSLSAVALDILVPYWGDPDLMRETVESVFAQQRDDWRLLVVDDAYPDRRITDWLAGLDDPRVSVVRHEANVGITANYRECLARATQELPVIVCTGAIRLAQDLQGQLTAKNVGLVLKPFDIDDLVREVNHVMGRDTAAAQRGD